jgi:PTS system fructose-specific IIB component
MKSGIIKQCLKPQPNKNQESLMKIVGVAACITGVAHTYMAQEAIEQECKKRGYDVKVETQGGMGIENELSEDEIAEADVVILAIAIGIEGVERFEEKEDAGLVISLNPAEVVRDPAAIIDKAEKLVQ